MVVRGAARSNFASQHLAAAEHFRDQVAQIESSSGSSTTQFAPPQYRHCWFAPVAFAAMAMEANAYDQSQRLN